MWMNGPKRQSKHCRLISISPYKSSVFVHPGKSYIIWKSNFPFYADKSLFSSSLSFTLAFPYFFHKILCLLFFFLISSFLVFWSEVSTNYIGKVWSIQCVSRKEGKIFKQKGQCQYVVQKVVSSSSLTFSFYDARPSIK